MSTLAPLKALSPITSKFLALSLNFNDFILLNINCQIKLDNSSLHM